MSEGHTASTTLAVLAATVEAKVNEVVTTAKDPKEAILCKNAAANHSNDGIAEFWCIECKKPLCHSCNAVLHRGPEPENWEVGTKHARFRLTELWCSIHKSPKKLWCGPCNLAICLECPYDFKDTHPEEQVHDGHNPKKVDLIIAGQTRKLEKEIVSYREKENSLQRKKRGLEQEERLLKEKHNEEEKNIKDVCDRLIECVKALREQHLKVLSAHVAEQEKLLKEQIRDTTTAYTTLKESIDSAESYVYQRLADPAMHLRLQTFFVQYDAIRRIQEWLASKADGAAELAQQSFYPQQLRCVIEPETSELFQRERGAFEKSLTQMFSLIRIGYLDPPSLSLPVDPVPNFPSSALTAIVQCQVTARDVDSQLFRYEARAFFGEISPDVQWFSCECDERKRLPTSDKRKCFEETTTTVLLEVKGTKRSTANINGMQVSVRVGRPYSVKGTHNNSSSLQGEPVVSMMWSNWSEPCSVPTADVPQCPALVSIEVKSPPTSIGFRWETPVSDCKVSLYTVRYGPKSSDLRHESRLDSSSEPFQNQRLDITGLLPESEYAVQMCATSEAGTGPWSGVLFLKTQSLPAPTLSHASAGNEVTLQWSVPPLEFAVENHEVQFAAITASHRNLVWKPVPGEVRSVGNWSWSSAAVRLPVGGFALFRVRCSTKYGWTAWSDQMSISAPWPVLEPELKCEARQTLRWSLRQQLTAGAVTHHKLQYATVPVKATQPLCWADCPGKIEQPKPGQWQCAAPRPVPGCTRLFRVRCGLKEGPMSEWSNEVAIWASECPTAPNIKTVSASSTSITLSWRHFGTASVDEYLVEYARQGHPLEWRSSTLASGNALLYTIDGLSIDSEYLVRVCGVNRSGAGPFSASLSIRTSPPAPTWVSCTHRPSATGECGVSAVIKVPQPFKALEFQIRPELPNAQWKAVQATVDCKDDATCTLNVKDAAVYDTKHSVRVRVQVEQEQTWSDFSEIRGFNPGKEWYFSEVVLPRSLLVLTAGSASTKQLAGLPECLSTVMFPPTGIYRLIFSRGDNVDGVNGGIGVRLGARLFSLSTCGKVFDADMATYIKKAGLESWNMPDSKVEMIVNMDRDTISFANYGKPAVIAYQACLLKSAPLRVCIGLVYPKGKNVVTLLD